MEILEYEHESGAVVCKGLSLEDGPEFNHFLQNQVASRLNDSESARELKAHLASLASTGFAIQNLSDIFDAEVPEERDWAIGEALAESWLAIQHGVVWPWNNERDKRTPMASLPGADLVGFVTVDGETRLVLGEVKTSSDSNCPPGVMSGRSGMIHQLDNLVTNLSILSQLIIWLWPRCKGTEYQSEFDNAVSLLLDSGNSAIYLFGVLLRDVEPNKMDLENRCNALAAELHGEVRCQLIAVYLPFSISDLPSKISSDSVQ